MRTRTESDAKGDAERRLVRDVAEYGWHVVNVPAQGKTPGWSFSVGLFKTFSHPEVVVFGLPGDVGQSMINLIGERVQNGERFEDRSEADELLEGVRCAFRQVVEKWHTPFLGLATWFYRGNSFAALQCIWPDHEQNFPWERKFRRDWLWAQPLLFEESAADARTVDLLRSMKR